MEAEPTTTLQPNSANSEPENNNNSSNSKNVTLSSNSNSKYPSSSKLLEDVVLVPNSSTSSNPLDQTSGFQGQSGMSRQEALADATGKAAQTRPQMQLTESLIKPLLKEKDEEQEVKKRNSTCCTDEPSDDAPKTPISDVYCWRKYGQKQVKSSGSSRSYYRCTYLSCCAKKKVQHLDISGKIIDVVYKGVHNHDPPRILKGSSRKKDFATRVLNNSSVQSLKSPRSHTCETELKQLVPMAIECQDINLKSVVGTPSRDAEDQHTKTIDSITRPENELVIVPAVEEPRGLRSDRSNQHIMINPMKVLDVAPLKKRRIKEGGKACSESVYRTFKNPKIVVHTAGDVAKSSDGYRWRKYGQKIVKGNLHPRSYYRCSSSGCPVRKHVERATDNSTAIIVTYEGKHDHDVPLPKRHQPHASPNSTACGPNMLLETSDIKSLSQGSAEERSKDMDCDIGEEKASEPGRDKVLEPARMLLSIGVELKSC